MRSTRRFLTAGKFISFRRAPGFQQAAKERLAAQGGGDLPIEQVPAYVLPNFITEIEEAALLRFTDAMFAPLPFATGHYDELIEHYKEFYRPWRSLSNPNLGYVELDDVPDDAALPREAAKKAAHDALARARDEAQSFLPFTPLQDRVHFLQLEPRGFIRAHADEQRNSSGIVAGLTLRSGRVMTLTHPGHPGAAVELLLAPRSLYVLAGAARNDWLHSVDWSAGEAEVPPVAGSPVVFDGEETGICRDRRTAVIFRGLSPMELFMHRMKGREAQQPAPQEQ